MRAALSIPLIALLLALACQSEPEVVYIVLTPTPVAPTIDVATATPSPTSTPAPTPTPTVIPSPTPSYSQALHRVDATPDPGTPRYEYMAYPDESDRYYISQPLWELLLDCTVAARDAGVLPAESSDEFIFQGMGQPMQRLLFSQGELSWDIVLPEGFEMTQLVDGDPLTCRYP